ncbi:MAG: hypothetical protein QXU47_06695 [Candidatus Bathyarchaeia archaeon]
MKDEVNWFEELRNYVIERVKNIRGEKILKKVVEELRKQGPANVPKGFSIKSVREDRY